MKILDKIKKIFIVMIMGIAGICTKIFAISDPLYGFSNESFIPEPSLWEKMLDAVRFLIIIPIVLIIGLIMYFNKSTDNKVKKVGLALIIIAVVVAIIALAIYIIGWFVSQ